MKKAAIAVVALPLLSMGAGYGAGVILAPAESHAAAAEEGADTAKDMAGQKDAAVKEDGAKAEDMAEGAAHPEMDRYELAKDRKVVRLGQITIPVQKTHSISYVVADLALKVESLELAERYRRVEDATRLRDSLFRAMNLAAESAVLRGVAIDSEALSQLLRDLISKDHAGVDDVMFVSLYKQDVARL